MICEKCGKEISDKVYPFHVQRCSGLPEEVIKVTEPEVTEEVDLDIPVELIKVELEKRGISFKKNLGKDKLLALLNEAKEEEE